MSQPKLTIAIHVIVDIPKEVHDALLAVMFDYDSHFGDAWNVYSMEGSIWPCSSSDDPVDIFSSCCWNRDLIDWVDKEGDNFVRISYSDKPFDQSANLFSRN